MSQRLLDTPSRHPHSFMGVLDSTWHNLSESIFKIAKKPIAKLAEAAVLSVLQQIEEGELVIVTQTSRYSLPSHEETKMKSQRPHLRSEIRVLDDVFWIRLCTMGDLGFAEAYMYGEIECNDLVSTFLIFLQNQKCLQGLDSSLSRLFSFPQKLFASRFVNNLSNSQSNISAHYDITNGLFSGFLSKDMTYSCAIFNDIDGDLIWSGTPITDNSENLKLEEHSDCDSLAPVITPTLERLYEGEIDELHQAQMQKLDHIIHQARIANGHRVLEIGSGWGSMAIRIAQKFPDTTIDTITLSVHQQSLARARIDAAGKDIAGRINIHLLDYRLMPDEWEGKFDRIVSVEMVEAVGWEFYEEYFRVIDWALKPGSGAGVVSSSTLPEARFERYINEVDFIKKWIFPGGSLPTLTSLINGLTKGSCGRLIVDSVSNIGPHYPRTLREWRKRFLTNFENIVEPALCAEHPEIISSERGHYEVEVFKRKWIYYFCYCEVGFATRHLGDHIITFSREGDESFACLLRG